MLRNITRQVYPGETVRLNADGYRWSVFVRTESDTWATELGSYAHETETYVPAMNLDSSLDDAANFISADDGDPVLNSAALNALRHVAETSRSVQIIFYDAHDAACIVVSLDFGEFGATDIDDYIAADKEFLKALEKARMGATTTDGVAVVKLPDGREETYRSIETLDRVIAITRERLAHNISKQGGSRFIGGYVT